MVLASVGRDQGCHYESHNAQDKQPTAPSAKNYAAPHGNGATVERPWSGRGHQGHQHSQLKMMKAVLLVPQNTESLPVGFLRGHSWCRDFDKIQHIARV